MRLFSTTRPTGLITMKCIFNSNFRNRLFFKLPFDQEFSLDINHGMDSKVYAESLTFPHISIKVLTNILYYTGHIASRLNVV